MPQTFGKSAWEFGSNQILPSFTGLPSKAIDPETITRSGPLSLPHPNKNTATAAPPTQTCRARKWRNAMPLAEGVRCVS